MTDATPELDVHPASEAERLEIYRNVHDVWGQGLDLDEHVARRLASPSHQRADWFAGVVEGRVAASLGCQPMSFSLRGRSVPGFAICSVHTLAEFRGRGLAPRLIAAVERFQSERGRELSLLYSDIGLEYYERLGYRAGLSHVGRVEPAKVVDDTAEVVAKSVSSDEYLARVSCLAGHRPLSIERSPDYWAHLGRREPHRRCFVVEDDELLGGFVLASRDDASVNLLEFDVADESQTGAVARAVVGTAQASGASRLEGWLPKSVERTGLFEVARRPTELTMLKPLVDTLVIDDEAVAATDWFHESDHV